MKSQNIKKMCAEYIQHCDLVRKLRQQTIINYRSQLRVFVDLMPKITETKHITVQSVSLFFERLQLRKRPVGRSEIKQGVKSSTILAYWTKLNPFFEWLVAREYLDENPLRKMHRPKTEYVDRKRLSKQEVEKIITAIEVNAATPLMLKRDRIIIYILLFCGLRKSELLRLQIRDADLEKRILTVRAETSKSKRTRSIPLNPTLRLHLHEYLEERKNSNKKTQYLITSLTRDRAFTVDGMKHWVKRIEQWSGVKFHIHQFRHTFACNLGAANASAIKIQKLMGHTDLRMTQRYLRSMDVEDLRDEVNKLTIDNLI